MVLTWCILLQFPERSHQTFEALQALVILAVQQDLLHINEQTRDAEENHKKIIN